MKKIFLIFAVGAMGLTVVNAQQQTRMDRLDRSQQEITHQLSDGVQLADLPSEMKEKIDDMIEERDAQLVGIDQADAGYELTFRSGERTWKQRFSREGRTEGGETQIDTERRQGQTQMGGQTQGQTQTQQRAQDARTEAGQRAQEARTEAGERAQETRTRAGERAQETRTQAGQQAQETQRTALEGASRIQNRDLPRNIRNTIDGNRDDRDAQIMSIERGTRDGQDQYDVTFNRDNRTYTRTYGSDGREIQMGDDQGTRGGQTGTQRQGTTGGQTQTGGTTGGQTQTGGTTGGQTRTGTGTTGGQTQTGGTTGGQTQTGGTTGGQTQTGGTTGGQTQTGGTTGGQTQTGGTTGGQTQTGRQTQTGGTTGGQIGQAGQRTALEGARTIQNRDMPRNIQNTIQANQEDRDAEITSIQRGTRDGQDNYDVTFRRDNRTWTRTYDREGKMIPERRDDN